MKQSVNFYDFRRAFHDMDRGEQFSAEGLGILFDYLEQYEEDTGTPMELDVIALCCEFAEDTPEGIAESYDIDLDGVEEDDIPQAVMDWLCDQTSVCGQTSCGDIVYCSSF